MGCLNTTVWSENCMIISSLSPKRSVKWNDPYLPKEQVQTKDGTTQQKRHGNKVPVVGLNLEDGGNMAGTSIEVGAEAEGVSRLQQQAHVPQDSFSVTSTQTPVISQQHDQRLSFSVPKSELLGERSQDYDSVCHVLYQLTQRS